MQNIPSELRDATAERVDAFSALAHDAKSRFVDDERLQGLDEAARKTIELGMDVLAYGDGDTFVKGEYVRRVQEWTQSERVARAIIDEMAGIPAEAIQ